MINMTLDPLVGRIDRILDKRRGLKYVQTKYISVLRSRYSSNLITVSVDLYLPLYFHIRLSDLGN
jgi:hypothetical protein